MIKVAKVVGLNSDTHAAQLLVATQSSDLNLYVVVVCKTEDAFTKARFALSEAEQVFFSTQDSISSRINQTLEKINELLSEAEEKEVVMAVLQDDSQETKAIYIMHSGNSAPSRSSSVLLLREGQLTDLCELGPSGQLVSGFLKLNDRLLITTLSIKGVLGRELEKVISLPIDLVEDEFIGRLPQAEVLPTASIILENRSIEIELKEESPLVSRHATLPRINLSQAVHTVTDLMPRVIPRSRQSLAILGGLILVVVLIGAVFSFIQRRSSASEAEFEGFYAQALEQFEKAKGLKDLDPSSSSQSIVLAEKALSDALRVKPEDNKALGLQREVNEQKGSILKVFDMPEISNWLDLELIKKGFSTNKLSLSLGKVVLVDKNLGSLVLIELGSKSHQILAGSDSFGEGELAAINGDSVFVYSADKGINRFNLQEDGVVEVTTPDESWTGVIDLFGFGSNVYLLDRGQIYKYVPIEKGYSGVQSYLKGETVVDFNTALRMQIDSSIWVLLSTGRIHKFTQGLEEEFNIIGLDKPLNSPRSFFVSDETENIYILDSGNQRLVVINKKGGYQSQYKSEAFAKYSDLIVSERDKKIYLLDGGKIDLLELQ
jgi:hypothetical protein